MTFIASVSDGTLTATILKQYIKTHDINDVPKGEHTSPLIAAVLAGEITSVELLLSVGQADPDRPTDDGMTPLAWVAERGRKNRAQVAWLLLQHKASIDAACKMGNTPLMRAVWSKDHELVRVLIDAKASTDHTNNVGESASSRAKVCGDEIDAMVNLKSGKPGFNLTDVVNILVGILRLILAWVNNASLMKVVEDVAQRLQSLDDSVKPPKSMDRDRMNSWVNSQGGSGGSGDGGRGKPGREGRDEDGSSSAGSIRAVGKDMGQSRRQGHPPTHRVDGEGIDPGWRGIQGDGAITARGHPIDEVSGDDIDDSVLHQKEEGVGNNVDGAEKVLRQRTGEDGKKPLGVNSEREPNDAAPMPPGANTQHEASDMMSKLSGINSKHQRCNAAPKPAGNIREQTTDDSEQKPPGIDDEQGPRDEEIEGRGYDSGEGLQASGGGRLTRDTSNIDRKQDSTRHEAGDTHPERDEPRTKARNGLHAVEPVQNGYGKESPRQGSMAGRKQTTIIDGDHTGQQNPAPVQTHKARAHEAEAKDTPRGVKSTQPAHENGHPRRGSAVDENQAGSIGGEHTQRQIPLVEQTPSDDGGSQIHGSWGGTSAQSGPSPGSKNEFGGDSPRTKPPTRVGGVAQEASKATGAPRSKLPGADAVQTPKTDPHLMGIVERRYGITGDQDLNAGKAVWKDEPETADDFLECIHSFMDTTGLGNFFSGPNRQFLQTVANKAVELLEDKEDPLSTPENIKKLVPVNLYQVVIYCDDSGSMRMDSRAKAQAALVERIARISTRLVPDGVGVELRFINAIDGELSNLDTAGVQRRMEALNITAGSYTRVGIGLRDRILKPLVYDVIEGQGTLSRPILVCIVTDGSPQNPRRSPPGMEREEFDTTRDVMAECAERLEKAGYPRTSVRFLCNQIGKDKKAGKFLTSLAEAQHLGDVIHVTAEKLDDVWKELRDNQRDLEEWLLTTLVSGITTREE